MGYMSSLVAYWDMGHWNPPDLSGPEYLGRNYGLIAQWKMNDNAANSTVTESINGHNGTYQDTGGAINTNTGSAAGKINTALDFDGDEEVEIASDDDWSPGLGDWAMSSWIKTSGAGPGGETHDRFLSCEIASRYWYLGITRATGLVRVGWNDGLGGVAVEGTTNVYDGAWHHVVGVIRRGESSYTKLYVYVDGVLETEQVVHYGYDTVGLAGAEVYLGSGGSSHYFDGLIDDTRVYTRVLGQYDVDKLYDDDNGTEAYGRHNGTGVNIDNTNLTKGIAGGVGLDFNGTDEYVDLGFYTTGYFGTTDFSIAFIMESTDDAAAFNYIIDGREQSADNKGYRIYLYEGKITFIVDDGSNHGTSNYGTSIADGAYHHIVCSADRDGLATVFVDGENKATADISSVGDISHTAYTTILGGNFLGAGNYEGILDEVMIFNSALTQLQAEDLRQRIMRGVFS